jgi:hypothetical protein
MWFPDNLEDSKNLFLSLIAGLVVAIITISIEIAAKTVADPQKVIVYITSGAVLFILFALCLVAYSNLKMKAHEIDKVKLKNK